MKIAAINGVSFSDSKLTVALVVSSECHFCAESVPFYRRLVELRERGTVQVVALSLEPTETLANYLQQNNVRVDRVAHLEGPTIIPTTGTPTLVLIGQDGTVRSSWLGRLDSQQEQDVLRAIKAS